MELAALAERAQTVRQLYSEMEQKTYCQSWGAKDIALGLIGDVGDLAKLVLAKEGVRDISDMDAKLAHELADCLWSVLVLARIYEVDLEAAFLETMDELEVKIRAQLRGI
jgi:NTP pyrophosphatase (non-canonical NTP hydrolase)